MTGQDIYIMASAFLYERDSEDGDSKHFAVPFLNILLQEALPTENSIRRFNGREILKAAPLITTLTAVIPYDDEITRVALPYGLAAQYYQEAPDNFQAENYRSKYLAALQDAAKVNFVQSDYKPFGEGDF